jgi:hypothetical protein
MTPIAGTTINPLTLVMLALLVVVLLAVKRFGSGKWGKRGKAAYSFAGCRLMSEAEIRFFRVLQLAVPNELVFPQVGMAALVRPNYAGTDARYIPAFRTISQKRIDFLVCNRDSLEVRCLVELDDSSHEAERDRERDAITAMAGYRTIRVRAARRYDINGLRRRVLNLTAEDVRVSG